MLEERIKAGKKMNFDDMMTIQTDTLDIYVRDNIDAILTSIEKTYEQIIPIVSVSA